MSLGGRTVSSRKGRASRPDLWSTCMSLTGVERVSPLLFAAMVKLGSSKPVVCDLDLR